MKQKLPPGVLKISPVPQEDGVSCGYCATRAVYDYYGVSSNGLRHRLGTDHGFLPALPGRDTVEKCLDKLDLRIGKYRYSDTQGTYCPDMFAVLCEDGFESEGISGFGIRAKGTLVKHVRSGNPAVGLIKWGHWIVISGANAQGVWIVDSQCRKPYFRTGRWCRENITGFILVRRKSSRTRRRMGLADYAWEYVRGSVFVLNMAGSTYGGIT